jgi:hypothetical protein
VKLSFSLRVAMIPSPDVPCPRPWHHRRTRQGKHTGPLASSHGLR